MNDRADGWTHLNVHHDDPDVGGCGGLVCPQHALLLDRVLRLPQPSCVADDHGVPCDVERHLDDITRCTRDGRDDRRRSSREDVEQAALAGVRRTQDGHLDAAAQHLAAPIVCQVRSDSRRQCRHAASTPSVSAGRMIAVATTRQRGTHRLMATS